MYVLLEKTCIARVDLCDNFESEHARMRKFLIERIIGTRSTICCHKLWLNYNVIEQDRLIMSETGIGYFMLYVTFKKERERDACEGENCSTQFTVQRIGTAASQQIRVTLFMWDTFDICISISLLQ